MGIDDFINNNTPSSKRSYLFEYFDEIKLLYSKGFTQGKIIEYIKQEYNVDVAQQTLSGFIARHLKGKVEIEQSTTRKSENPLEDKEHISIDFDNLDYFQVKNAIGGK